MAIINSVSAKQWNKQRSQQGIKMPFENIRTLYEQKAKAGDTKPEDKHERDEQTRNADG